MSRRPAIVIPTVGRPALGRLLRSLAAQDPPVGEVVVVDDRRAPDAPLPMPDDLGDLGERLRVLRGGGRGPAAARNAGWRAVRGDWVVMLDDDVAPDAGWSRALEYDLGDALPRVGAVQGRLRVPLAADRPPTDAERSVAGLEGARWITADMAYRRAALEDVGGFDERFPRAYREDSDLALRLLARDWRLVGGRRRCAHPPGSAGAWSSLRRQAGNADDALMRRLHGSGWRARAGAPRGRLPRHAAVSAAAAGAGAALLLGRRRTAALAGLAWTAGVTRFAVERIAPGPRTAREVAGLLVTSALIPELAVAHRLAGAVRARRIGAGGPLVPPPAAVLFDRDGTLVEDVPYNGDPRRVRPVPGAARALGRLHAARIPTAVVTNQSGLARGLLEPGQVDAVHERIEALIGPTGPWMVCPHGPDDGCACRKPRPGLILAAARRLGVDPRRCVVIGDIGADVDAAHAAGAGAVLVPTAQTRPEEVRRAGLVARDLEHAVELALGGARP